MTFRADRVGRRLRTLEKVEVDCRVVGSGDHVVLTFRGRSASRGYETMRYWMSYGEFRRMAALAELAHLDVKFGRAD